MAGHLLAVAASGANVTITLGTNHAGPAIPPGFSGLSFEVSLLLPAENGLHYFRPDNLPLLNLFRTLGIKNLRIGGNTSDRDVRRLPSEADLDSFFEFAKAANVKVIYCLRLHDGDPQSDAATAKYIMDHYPAQMDCFSIGQEPSAYPRIKPGPGGRLIEGMGPGFEKYPYSAYAAEWKRFASAIIAAVPEVSFCGPSVHNNGLWARSFLEDFGRGNHVRLITEHLYPGGAGGKVPTPEIGRERMLSDDFIRAYEKLYDGFVPQAQSNGLPYRLEEVNNYFNGGATNVSNTFAAALWGLDFMHWWASHDAAGVNFHTGDRVAAGNTVRASKYAAFVSTSAGFHVRPLGYGLCAFNLGGHGSPLPTRILNPDHCNVSVWATLGDEKHLFLTIINKQHGLAARFVDIALPQDPAKFSKAEILFLQAPDNNVAVTEGATLGGAEIQADGTWDGKWASLAMGNRLQFKVAASSAAILRFSKSLY